MLKKIIAGIAGLTFAFSVVVSSGTLQTKAMETTTETTAEETTDTDGSEVPMTIRVLDESPNDEMYLSGVAFQVTLDETGEIIQQFVYDGGDFTCNMTRPIPYAQPLFRKDINLKNRAFMLKSPDMPAWTIHSERKIPVSLPHTPQQPTQT